MGKKKKRKKMGDKFFQYLKKKRKEKKKTQQQPQKANPITNHKYHKQKTYSSMQNVFTTLTEAQPGGNVNKTNPKDMRYAHIFLIIIYALLMIVSIALLAVWIKGRIKRRRERKVGGYKSINNESYALAQSQLPATPSTAKGSWIQVYHICFIIGCLIRIFSFSLCFFFEEEEGSNVTNSSSSSSSSNSDSAYYFVGSANSTNIDMELLEKLDISFSFSGSYIFLLTFLIVLCCLAEVYHNAGDTEMQQRVRFIQSIQIRSGMSLRHLDAPTSSAIIRIYRATKVMVALMIVIIIGTFFMVFFDDSDEPNMQDPFRAIPQIFAIALYVIYFFGFLIYGILIFKQTYSLLKSFELKSNDTLKSSIHNAYVALSRIIFMVIVSTICFLARAVVVSLQMSENDNLSDDGWYVDIIYYAILEWLPLVSTLVIFVIIPSREKKDDDISIVPIASY